MSNKKAKQELIKRYGAECFIEKLHLRKDVTPRRYTSKNQMQKMKQLTYHHIKMKKDGGQATVENRCVTFCRKSYLVSSAKYKLSRLYERFISRI